MTALFIDKHTYTIKRKINPYILEIKKPNIQISAFIYYFVPLLSSRR